MKRSLAALALLLAPLVALPRASATPPPQIATVESPHTESGGRRVIEDAWRVDCATLSATKHCLVTLTARSFGAGVVVIVAPETLDGDGAVKLDGAPQWLTPVDDEGRGPVMRLAFDEGEHVLVVRRKVPLHENRLGGGWVFPADETRHLVLHEGQVDAERALHVTLTPPDRRANGYTLDLTVTRDRALRWVEVPIPGDPPWTHDGVTAHLRTQPAAVLGNGAVYDISPTRLVDFRADAEPFHFGGPMLGLGVGGGGGTSFRLRAELEYALFDWLLPGVALDADTTHGFELTPRLEVASPIVLILPSLSVGVGLPIRLEPDPDVGVRFLLGASFGPLGLVGSFDLFPAPGGVAVESAVLIRMSL